MKRFGIILLLMVVAVLSVAGLVAVRVSAQQGPAVGPPVDAATLAHWHTTVGVRFTDLPAPAGVAPAQAAIDEARRTSTTAWPDAPVYAVRYGILSNDQQYRQLPNVQTDYVLQNKRVWLVRFAHVNMPSAGPRGGWGMRDGMENVIVDAFSGKYIAAFAVGP